MDADAAREFIRHNDRAVMATTRSSGRPQMSPVTAGVDDEGYVVVSTREASMKVANLRRDPWASVLVFTEAFFGPWVRVDGPVEIVPLPEAMDGLVAIYRSVKGEHPDWDEYRQAMTDQGRVLLRLRIEEAGPDKAG
ncbi:MAG TPA: PPOX class F420-dependent oxidoreductase [Acidimicrobiales bacterium]|jgi:PPOX class probable F420-dependent enzyme|nr:PPOX class F420-dependent oxidoreductase [Acidimicrobiales bacterium]